MTPEVLKRFMEEQIPFNRFLGLRLVHAEAGYARLEVPFREELVGDARRPALHGGVISMLADTAGGAAVFLGIEDEHARVSTIDLRIDYLRPAKLEPLLAEARVVRVGNRVGVADVRLFQPSAEDVTVATGKGVYNITIPKRH